MAETPLRKLQPAPQNSWYKLATAGEYHVENRLRWNGYMRHLIGEAAAAKLKRADGTPIVLPTLSPDEMGWITRNIPGLLQELFKGISLSGLLFAEAVNFQDFCFPVSVDFGGSTFAGEADFEGSTFAKEAGFARSTFAEKAGFARSTFAEKADFEGSTFAKEAGFWGSTFTGPADFARSTFAKEAIFAGSTFAEYANFTESTFGGIAAFAKSTFVKEAIFAGSTFAEKADFEGSTFVEKADFEAQFAKEANFTESTFGGIAAFAKSTFTGTVDFSNAKYEGKTSFQNVTFTVAPLFFETTLHEDTDWTDVDWPDKPADKEEATQYVRRYERLALIMSTLKQPDNEHRFFRLSMQAKEVRDGEGISTGLSRLYGRLFCYGWGLERALKLWVFHILLGAGCLSVVPPCTMSYPLSGLTALAISFSNSLPFLGLHRGPAKSAYASFDTLTGFNILGGIQSVIGPLLLFFLLLTIRNRFRLR